MKPPSSKVGQDYPGLKAGDTGRTVVADEATLADKVAEIYHNHVTIDIEIPGVEGSTTWSS